MVLLFVKVIPVAMVFDCGVCRFCKGVVKGETGVSRGNVGD